MTDFYGDHLFKIYSDLLYIKQINYFCFEGVLPYVYVCTCASQHMHTEPEKEHWLASFPSSTSFFVACKLDSLSGLGWVACELLKSAPSSGVTTIYSHLHLSFGCQLFRLGTVLMLAQQFCSLSYLSRSKVDLFYKYLLI